MEALWTLEDKLKLTTQEAILIFVCSAVAVVGLCAATLLRRKAQRKENIVGPDPNTHTGGLIRSSEPGSDWVTIRRVLLGSVQWSEGSMWEEESAGSWEEMTPPPSLPPPLLLQPAVRIDRSESNIGRRSHNSILPVWQRPILMGDKCELPRFSGLILYDERGRLLDQSLTSSRKEHNHQEKPAADLATTTLKDLF